MNVNSENLRLVMGFKLKQFRLENGLSLKDLAAKTDLSISYLSEIEKGKKYPKPEKIFQLAEALKISFDELVSLQMNKDFDPLPVVFSSPVIKEFPFRMYGVSPQDLLALITGDPEKSGALIRTFLEIGQDYNMRVEHLLLAALRSYQQMHHNYFEDIENAADAFTEKHHLPASPPLTKEMLQQLLQNEYQYEIDEETLSGYPEVDEIRSVFVCHGKPKLLLQKKLLDSQKAFQMGRELGFQYLKLKERPKSAVRMIASFEQLLNNFKSSYFAGALMMNRSQMKEDIRKFLGSPHWDGNKILQLIEKYDVTPEMFLYRLSALMPRFFNLREIIFVRFHHEVGTDNFEMTKIFNLSKLFIPNGIGAKEHYCRRWMGIKLMKQMGKWHGELPQKPLVGAQRLKFSNDEREVFSINLAYPSQLVDNRLISVTICFVMNEAFKRTVAFWDDPLIPHVEVNETCERCGFSAEKCSERAVPGIIFNREQLELKQEEILSQILKNL